MAVKQLVSLDTLATTVLWTYLFVVLISSSTNQNKIFDFSKILQNSQMLQNLKQSFPVGYSFLQKWANLGSILEISNSTRETP